MGKKGKSKTATVIHGVVTSEMTKEEIEKFVILLRAELDRERTERNMLCLERDKVTTFWELSKKQADDARNMLRKKERELEDAEERHQMEMRIYRQKVKHMLFEQNARQSDVKKETSVTMNSMADETRVEVREMHNENYTLKAQLRFKQLESEESVKMLKRQHESEMTSIRQEFMVQAEEMEQRTAKQTAMLREELETQRVSEIHATEERKNMHIKQLEMAHDKAYNGMKSYYNDITLGNVNVIKTLRESIEELRSNLIRMQRDLEASLAETAKYKKMLDESEEQNKSLRKVVRLYEAEKFAHSVTKANLKVMKKEKTNNEMLYNIAQARLEELEAHTKKIENNMESMFLEIKQKAGLRAAILERKLGFLVSTLEARETELHNMEIAINSDPKAVLKARKNIEDLFSKKNTAINELQYEVSRIAKAYTDLWGACKQKLAEELSHPVNMGIKPIQANASMLNPFNPATAQARLLNLTSGKPGTASALITGKGPLALTSIPP